MANTGQLGERETLRTLRYDRLLGLAAGDPRANAVRDEDPAVLVHRNDTHDGALIDFLVNSKLEPVAGRFHVFLERAQGAGTGRDASVKLIRDVYGLSPAELEDLRKQHHGLRRGR